MRSVYNRIAFHPPLWAFVDLIYQRWTLRRSEMSVLTNNGNIFGSTSYNNGLRSDR